MAEHFILDEPSLERLFDNYFKSLSSFAFGYLCDEELALEIVQDCFAELWCSRHRLSTDANLKSYLYMMVRNACISHLRRTKHRTISSEATTDTLLETNIIKWEAIRILYDAIAELSLQSREIINHALDGHTNQQIADMMDISVNTVHTVKKRAYKKLRGILKDYYFLLPLIMP